MEAALGDGAHLDFAILNFLKDNDLPGATVAVTRGGRLIWSKAYGYADADAGTLMQPWHRTRIGSVSKVITAIGAMKLIESGKLSLEDRIYSDPGTYDPSASWPRNLGTPSLLPNPEEYWRKMLEGVRNVHPADSVHFEMNRTAGWARVIHLKHLLSHTSGMRKSDDVEGAAKHFNKDVEELNYGDVHQYFLTAPRKAAPFQFLPGTKRAYSNAGFALSGYIIGLTSGLRYEDYIRQEVLVPLGLTNVVPFNTNVSQLDAKPHDGKGDPEELDPDNPSWLRTGTGGWAASARDLVRLMCSLDRRSNGARVLSPESVTTMHTAPVPKFATHPIGWDWRVGNVLSKNGSIDGGVALIRKYLPGARHKTDEINVAIAINKQGAMPHALIERIARAAAAVPYIPDDFDLFDPHNRCFIPPKQPELAPTVDIVGFYPARSNNLMPAKIEKCPATITLKGAFNNFPQGKLEYRFRFAIEGRVSTTYSTLIKGNPKDPLYVPNEVYHDVPLPLPAVSKPQGQGGVPPGPGEFAVYEEPHDGLPPAGPKGPQGPGGIKGQGTPDNVISGTVRLEALTAKGVVSSGPLAYRLECEPEMAVLSGTVDLRDESPKAPGCPRPASVGASIRTNKAGPVDYVLACTGQGRTWKGKTVAHQTAPNTFIGVVVHPIQIAQQEDITCFLRRGEQFGFSDVLANGRRLYPCQVVGVTTPDPVPPPPPPGPPGGFVSDPPRFVCIGGRTVGSAPRQVCECPRGQERRQTAANRFECVPSVPDLVCQGGRVAGKGTAAACICPAGQVARQVAPNRFACETQLVCEGGKVVMRGLPPVASCECPPGSAMQRVPALPVAPSIRAPGGAERFRCVRVVVDPVKPGGGGAVPCRGGTVRAGQCVCPRGEALIKGMCVKPAM